ncbi:MAG: serine hydrolase, partial [Phaeodactylibacter sp.]|nr:serine hydrolase [Phaeodactylibacter sp.]
MLQSFIENKKLGGINCLIWKDGQIVWEASYGYQNLETQTPLPIDALFRISSMTKPVTSVLAMI